MDDKKLYTQEQFLELLNKLIKETGFTISAHPELKYRDDGTWSLVVVQTIEKLLENKQ